MCGLLWVAACCGPAPQLVLGAYYGTGKKGGLLSTFLCGVYDSTRRQWVTVCKVREVPDVPRLVCPNPPPPHTHTLTHTLRLQL
jgi:hypothetical protein